MLTSHRQAHAVGRPPHAAPARLAAASALTLPAFPGTADFPGEKIPTAFTIKSDASAEVTAAAFALVDAGYLTVSDWELSGGNTTRAIQLAVGRLAAIRTTPLAGLDVVITNKADKVDMEDADPGSRYNDAADQYNKKYRANVSRLGVIVVHVSYEEVWHAVIGPQIKALEKCRPGLGHAVLRCLTDALDKSCRACDPVSAYYWAQNQYWMGEKDETLWVEENIADAEANHDQVQAELPPAERKPFDPAKAADYFDIFKRKDYDADIPLWAGSEHHSASPTTFTPEQLERLRVPPKWRATVRAASAAGRLARTAPRPYEANDLSLFEAGCWEVVPFILHWYRKKAGWLQDCIAQIYDDTLNDIWNCGDRNTAVNTAFAFHDGPSLVKALRRFENYLRLVNAAENILTALKITPL